MADNMTGNMEVVPLGPVSSGGGAQSVGVPADGPYILVLRVKATLANVAALCLLCSMGFPSVSHHVYTSFRLVFGNLYPAYASYKAVKTKNVKEYVRWMMYWIVFALFTCAETITDIFLSFWFPFYYELKIVAVLWLLSPYTRGSSILYRQFVHPALTRREQEIDECITKAKEQGYSTVLQLGSKGMSMATSFIMQTAFKGGGELMSHLRRTQSLGDLVVEREGDVNRNSKALPAIADQRYEEGDNTEEMDYYQAGDDKTEIYFQEVDVPLRRRVGRPREKGIDFSHIRSSEDVSYRDDDPSCTAGGGAGVPSMGQPTSLSRTGSMGSSRVRGGTLAASNQLPNTSSSASPTSGPIRKGSFKEDGVHLPAPIVFGWYPEDGAGSVGVPLVLDPQRTAAYRPPIVTTLVTNFSPAPHHVPPAIDTKAPLAAPNPVRSPLIISIKTPSLKQCLVTTQSIDDDDSSLSCSSSTLSLSEPTTVVEALPHDSNKATDIKTNTKPLPLTSDKSMAEVTNAANDVTNAVAAVTPKLAATITPVVTSSADAIVTSTVTSVKAVMATKPEPVVATVATEKADLAVTNKIAIASKSEPVDSMIQKPESAASTTQESESAASTIQKPESATSTAKKLESTASMIQKRDTVADSTPNSDLLTSKVSISSTGPKESVAPKVSISIPSAVTGENALRKIPESVSEIFFTTATSTASKKQGQVFTAPPSLNAIAKTQEAMPTVIKPTAVLATDIKKPDAAPAAIKPTDSPKLAPLSIPLKPSAFARVHAGDTKKLDLSPLAADLPPLNWNAKPPPLLPTVPAAVSPRALSPSVAPTTIGTPAVASTTIVTPAVVSPRALSPSVALTAIVIPAVASTTIVTHAVVSPPVAVPTPSPEPQPKKSGGKLRWFKTKPAPPPPPAPQSGQSQPSMATAMANAIMGGKQDKK